MYDNHSTSSSEAETIELIDEVDKEVLCEFHKPTPKLFPRLLFRKLERTMVSAGNCEIFRATRRVDGKLVAIKRLNITSVDPLSVTFFENEARMARIVSDCEGVVRTHACYRTRHHIWLVMDWINGSMLKKLAMHMPLHSAHVAYIARHVLSCLLWFHQRGISHRDIKPTNIMVDDDASLFVIDLGYAKIHTKENPIDTEVVGTLVYMAPEVIAGTGHAMTADIWSLGMTVYELLCGHPPYVGCDVTTIARHVRSGDIPAFPEALRNSPAAHFAHKCLQRYPGQRPSASQLLRDSFISSACSHDMWRDHVKSSLPDWPNVPDS